MINDRSGLQNLEMVLDEEFYIQAVSPGLEVFLGLNPGSLRGLPFEQIFRLSTASAEPVPLALLGQMGAQNLLLEHAQFCQWGRLQSTALANNSQLLRFLPLQPNELLPTNQYFLRAFEHAAIGMATMSPSGHFMYANPAFSRLLGYSQAELLTMSFQQLSLAQEQSEELLAFTRLVQGEITDYELEKRCLHKDQHSFWVLWSVSRIQGQQGEEMFIFAQAQDISQRRQQAAILKAERHRLKVAEKLAHLGYWEKDLRSGKAIWSEEYFCICGLEPGSIEPSIEAGYQLLHPDDQGLARQALETSVQTFQPYKIAKRILRPDGEVRYVESVGEVVLEEGSPVSLRGAFLDITEHYLQKQSLQEGKQILKGFFDHVPLMMGVVELQGETLVHLSYNASTARFWGLEPQEIEQSSPRVVNASSETLALWRTLYLRSESSQQSEQLEYLHMQGEQEVCLRVTVSPVDLARRRFCYVAEDITLQKRLYTDILRIQAVLDNVTTNVMIANPEFEIVYLNQAAYQLFERTLPEIIKVFPDFDPQQLLGKSIDYFHKLPHHQHHLLQDLKGVYHSRIELGSLTFEMVAVKAENAAGKVLGYAVEWTDITETLQAAKALKETQTRFESIFNSVYTFVVLLDITGVVLEANQIALELLPDQHQPVLGLPLSETPWFNYTESLQTLIRQAVEDAAQGQFVRFEVELKGPDGKLQPIDFTIRPVRDETGEVKYLVPEGRDITEAKKYAQSLLASNRELEQFAYIASHDLQEPLRKIQAFGSRLQGQLEGKLSERENDYFVRMQQAAARMQALIQDLLQYSKLSLQKKPFEWLDLQAVFQAACETLELQIEEAQASIICDPLPAIKADKRQIEQLFQNLLSNALKFQHPQRIPKITIKCQIISDKYVKIKVVDNGIGFEPRYQEQIFQVFQRLHARNAYEGTGIGLSLCRKIVQRHGGEMSAIGWPDKGAQFEIILPLESVEDESHISGDSGRRR